MNKSLFKNIDFEIIENSKKILSKEQSLFLEGAIYRTRLGKVNSDGYLFYPCQNEAQRKFIRNLYSLSIETSNEPNGWDKDADLSRFNLFEGKYEVEDGIYIKLWNYKNDSSVGRYWRFEFVQGPFLSMKDLEKIIPLRPGAAQEIVSEERKKVNRWEKERKVSK